MRMVHFGPDGFMYISNGDGGGERFDPLQRSQNIKEPFGKILRIDVDVDEETGVGGDVPYYIPHDNPYTFSTLTPWWEIYATGLRNPWRCSFDVTDMPGESETRLYCGDVGQDDREEVDLIVKGGNYGWPVLEGHQCRGSEVTTCNKTQDMIEPIISYDHNKVGNAVIGGYVYRGSKNLLPSYQGKYIFADHFSNTVFYAHPHTPADHSNYTFGVIPVCKDCPCGSGAYGDLISSFGRDVQGELYLLTIGLYSPDARDSPTGTRAGEVYKIMQWQQAQREACTTET